MKIIHITPSYKPAYVYGGPIFSVAALCEALADQDVRQEVMTTTANGHDELRGVTDGQRTYIKGVRVTYYSRVTGGSSHFSPSLLWSLYKKIKKYPGETVVHIHSWWNFTSIFSCLICVMTQTAIVLSPRGMLSAYSFKHRHSLIKNLMHKIAGVRLLQRCHIHATSEQEAREITEVVSAKTIATIFNILSFKPTALSKQIREQQDKAQFRILFLSRIDPKKGLEQLMEAVSLLNFDWQLNIAGTGCTAYIDRLESLSRKLGIDSRIAWVGYKKGIQKYDLLMNNDLLALTSHNENFSNVIAEGLMAGIPVLASNAVGLAPLIRQLDLGWICGLDPCEIATTIEMAHQDSMKRAFIRDTGPSLASTFFCEKSLTNQYLRLYRNAL
ncbi:XrtY-associated glycosyltransferase XYAG1 [Pedobacter faecalis]|uniref:XrtY-associated glycosyltransferase XYAG1 n=1 Tax=Pedobacter faecalis TaxID=3041495 RepID=UPI00254D2F15|nr:glycosyltransferase [Pedobacter sp. ELA7]